MSEVTKSLRHRINVSRGMGGKYSFEATVEYSTQATLETTPYVVAHDADNAREQAAWDRKLSMEFSDALIAELEKRYPAENKG